MAEAAIDKKNDPDMHNTGDQGLNDKLLAIETALQKLKDLPGQIGRMNVDMSDLKCQQDKFEKTIDQQAPLLESIRDFLIRDKHFYDAIKAREYEKMRKSADSAQNEESNNEVLGAVKTDLKNLSLSVKAIQDKLRDTEAKDQLIAEGNRILEQRVKELTADNKSLVNSLETTKGIYETALKEAENNFEAFKSQAAKDLESAQKKAADDLGAEKARFEALLKEANDKLKEEKFKSEINLQAEKDKLKDEQTRANEELESVKKKHKEALKKAEEKLEKEKGKYAEELKKAAKELEAEKARAAEELKAEKARAKEKLEKEQERSAAALKEAAEELEAEKEKAAEALKAEKASAKEKLEGEQERSAAALKAAKDELKQVKAQAEADLKAEREKAIAKLEKEKQQLKETENALKHSEDKLKVWQEKAELYIPLLYALQQCKALENYVAEKGLLDNSILTQFKLICLIGESMDFANSIYDEIKKYKKDNPKNSDGEENSMTEDEQKLYGCLNACYGEIFRQEDEEAFEIFKLPGGQNVKQPYEKVPFDKNEVENMNDPKSKGLKFAQKVYVPVLYNINSKKVYKPGQVKAGNN